MAKEANKTIHSYARDFKHNFLIIYAMCRSMKSFNCQSSLQILRISSVKFPSFLILEKTRLVHAEEKQNCTVWDWMPRYQVEKEMSQTIYFLSHCTYIFFCDPIPFVFQKKLSESSFIFDGKFTFQLMMMTQWPHGIYNIKHLKYVERRYFWHIKKTFLINHHVEDTVTMI